ncbi:MULTISPECIES: hypothetical protein [Gemella]|uniref:hypothetical protein n=1 Tax=Gemella TaxID=1378 RepID=UPI00076815F6|nr:MULTISPECIES: hypothetical protein [Gemella]AME08986.1 exonuclease SbcC [Gemella sp. oral taxon 928]AXI26558.1 exonuclease SbcC [Gemella sp. ND 6198]
MKFKYHRAYRGFYLLDNNKFKRPFMKLDEDKTIKLLNDAGIEIIFNKKELITIEDRYVIFYNKEKAEGKHNIKKSLKIDFKKLELDYQIPKVLIENIYKMLNTPATASKELESTLSIISNIMISDRLFATKVKNIFFYNEKELDLILNRYNLKKISIDDLKKEIELNYPKQYISPLPLDYKEHEMIFVFYFIIQVELLTVLK